MAGSCSQVSTTLICNFRKRKRLQLDHDHHVDNFNWSCNSLNVPKLQCWHGDWTWHILFMVSSILEWHIVASWWEVDSGDIFAYVRWWLWCSQEEAVYISKLTCLVFGNHSTSIKWDECSFSLDLRTLLSILICREFALGSLSWKNVEGMILLLKTLFMLRVCLSCLFNFLVNLMILLRTVDLDSRIVLSIKISIMFVVDRELCVCGGGGVVDFWFF